jgi:hypothetical protein
MGDNSFWTMITPTILDPGIQILENKNFWGGPVWKQPYTADDNTPKSHMSFKSTGQIWKDMAQGLNWLGGGDQWHSSWLDIHPESLRHIFRYATGGAGAFVNRTGENVGAMLYGFDIPGISGDAPLQPEKLAFLRKIYGQVWKGVDSQQFYEHRQTIRETMAEYKDRKDAAEKLGGDSADMYRQFRRDNRAIIGDGEHKKTPGECIYSGGGMVAAMKTTECEIKELRSSQRILENRESNRKTKDRIRELDQQIRQKQRRFNSRWNKQFYDRGWLKERMED